MPQNESDKKVLAAHFEGEIYTSIIQRPGISDSVAVHACSPQRAEQVQRHCVRSGCAWRRIAIQDSDLSMRLRNSLRRFGFETLGDIVDACLGGHPVTQRNMAFIGIKTRAELLSWLEEKTGFSQSSWSLSYAPDSL